MRDGDKMISHIMRMPPNKTFGFIKGVGLDEDYFFHKDDLNYDFELLRKEHGSQVKVNVQFDVVENGTKGFKAINVTRI
jgi:cold shock CspA family protein